MSIEEENRVLKDLLRQAIERHGRTVNNYTDGNNWRWKSMEIVGGYDIPADKARIKEYDEFQRRVFWRNN